MVHPAKLSSATFAPFSGAGFNSVGDMMEIVSVQNAALELSIISCEKVLQRVRSHLDIQRYGTLTSDTVIKNNYKFLIENVMHKLSNFAPRLTPYMSIHRAIGRNSHSNAAPLFAIVRPEESSNRCYHGKLDHSKCTEDTFYYAKISVRHDNSIRVRHDLPPMIVDRNKANLCPLAGATFVRSKLWFLNSENKKNKI